MKKTTLIILSLLTIQQTTFGQVSGNQAFSTTNQNYGYYNYYGRKQDIPQKRDQLLKLYLSDTSFIIQANILKNIKADYYIAVFGVSQEGQTVLESNTKINERVKKFIDNIKAIGIKETDIYTDIITQYRIYDISRNKNSELEEYLKGFELSKNIIIKYNQPNQIEQLLTIASKENIFDLIKVDYIVEDVSKVYEEMFQLASDIIKKKKDLYLKLTSATVLSSAQIYAENFASYYPIESYRNYTAFSTNYYDSYWWSNDKRKAMRKFETFYYDKIDYSGFDKIVNATVLEPLVQFVLTLQVKYDLKK